MHSIDIYFGEQWSGCRDDWRYKYLLCFAHLADMTCLYKPIDVVTHELEGPPIVKDDMCVHSEVSVVSCIVMH